MQQGKFPRFLLYLIDRGLSFHQSIHRDARHPRGQRHNCTLFTEQRNGGGKLRTAECYIESLPSEIGDTTNCGIVEVVWRHVLAPTFTLYLCGWWWQTKLLESQFKVERRLAPHSFLFCTKLYARNKIKHWIISVFALNSPLAFGIFPILGWLLRKAKTRHDKRI